MVLYGFDSTWIKITFSGMTNWVFVGRLHRKMLWPCELNFTSFFKLNKGLLPSYSMGFVGKIKSIAWQLMSSLSSTLTLNFLFAPWRLGFWNVAFWKVWWFVMDLEKWLMVNFGWIFNQHGCFSVNLSGSHFRLASSNALFRGNNLATPHVKCESWGWHLRENWAIRSRSAMMDRIEQSTSTKFIQILPAELKKNVQLF